MQFTEFITHLVKLCFKRMLSGIKFLLNGVVQIFSDIIKHWFSDALGFKLFVNTIDRETRNLTGIIWIHWNT